jgi:hypothetical protein
MSKFTVALSPVERAVPGRLNANSSNADAVGPTHEPNPRRAFTIVLPRLADLYKETTAISHN